MSMRPEVYRRAIEEDGKICPVIKVEPTQEELVTFA